jgi:hypothetical protein
MLTVQFHAFAANATTSTAYWVGLIEEDGVSGRALSMRRFYLLLMRILRKTPASTVLAMSAP